MIVKMRERLDPADLLARTVMVLLLAAPLAVQAAGQAKGDESPIRVATWNLKWFGHPNTPRTSADLAAVAERLATWGVHVLAFQEMAVTRLGPSGEPRSYALDEVVETLAEAHGQSWEYWIHKGKGEQHLGFIWRDDRVDLVAAPVYGLKTQAVENQITVKGEKKTEKKTPWYRAPVIAHVRLGDGLTDFSIVNVHLKATEPQFGNDSFWETRRAECESLAAWIDGVWNPAPAPPAKPVPKKPVPPVPVVSKLFGAVPFGAAAAAPAAVKAVLSHVDPDLAVLGDFNSAVHPDLDATPLISLGMHFLGGGESTHVSGAALDRVLVSVPMGEEHTLSQASVPKGQAFAVAPGAVGGSDHFLVTFTVAVRPDDD